MLESARTQTVVTFDVYPTCIYTCTGLFSTGIQYVQRTVNQCTLLVYWSVLIVLCTVYCTVYSVQA